MKISSTILKNLVNADRICSVISRLTFVLFSICCTLLTFNPIPISAQEETAKMNESRMRARDAGIETGIFRPGPLNAITDVEHVMVGHKTIWRGDSIRTGVTAILPHRGNLFKEKVAAAIYTGNGFGKLQGYTQVEELGEIESPILLTNTLNVPKVADAAITFMLGLPGNEDVRSINVVVGETNDGALNDIRNRHIDAPDVFSAITSASGGMIAEGCVGAGAGTRCLGFKGGIGTSSRVLPASLGGYTIGVLVQSNFGGILQINGAPVGRELGVFSYKDKLPYPDGDGSIMVVVATDAPVGSRNLKRLAKRAMLGIGRTGGYASNGSGDYIIAFSTKNTRHSTETRTRKSETLNNSAMSPLFLAVIEATEEAILNSIFMARTTKGIDGNISRALPLDKTISILKKYRALKHNEKLPSWNN